MSAPTPDEMIDWIAMFVTQINSLEAPNGETIEMLAADGANAIVVTRTVETRNGPDYFAAFRECVEDGMKQIKL